MKSMMIHVNVPDDAVCKGCPHFRIDTGEITTLYADGKAYETFYKCEHESFCEDLIGRMRQLFNDQQYRGGF